MSVRTYRDGGSFVVVQTRQAHETVEIGTGDTLREATESLEPTPIQSTGRDCGVSAALEWARHAGWISGDELHEVPENKS